jgi:hypothetical protein
VAPAFSADGTRIFYSSNEDDDIFNLRSLDLRTGVIAQYSDVLGGNMAPQALPGRGGDRMAFISYFKGDYGLFSLDTAEPMKEVDQEVQSAAEGLVDYQPDVVHQVIPENKRRKKLFEKLYLEGRPPLNLAVAPSVSSGTQVALTDVLGTRTCLHLYSIHELPYQGATSPSGSGSSTASAPSTGRPSTTRASSFRSSPTRGRAPT